MRFKYSILKTLSKTISPEKLEKFSKSHNYNTRSAKLKPIEKNNNRGGSPCCVVVSNYTTGTYWDGRWLFCLSPWQGGCRPRYRSASSWHPFPPSRSGHAVGEEDLSRAAFILAFDWLSGCPFAFLKVFK